MPVACESPQRAAALLSSCVTATQSAPCRYPLPHAAQPLASPLPIRPAPDAYFLSGAGSLGGPGTRLPHHTHAPSLGAAAAAGGGGGGAPSAAGLGAAGPGCAGAAGGCRGQSLSLVGTLLAEALARGPGSGLCIADCNAYVQVGAGGEGA